MNKKQLYTKIMNGVERSLLNEGFSSWKEENTPKFDMETFNANMLKLLELVNKYISEKYFERPAFGYIDERNDKKMLMDSRLGWDFNPSNVVKNLSTAIKDKFGNKVAQLMPNIFIYIGITKNSDFDNYIKAHTDPAYAHKIKDCEYIIYDNSKPEQPAIAIKGAEIVDTEHFNAIMDFIG